MLSLSLFSGVPSPLSYHLRTHSSPPLMNREITDIMEAGKWEKLDHFTMISVLQGRGNIRWRILEVGKVIVRVSVCVCAQGCSFRVCLGSSCRVYTPVRARILATPCQVHLFDGHQPKYICGHIHTHVCLSYLHPVILVQYYNDALWFSHEQLVMRIFTAVIIIIILLCVSNRLF